MAGKSPGWITQFLGGAVPYESTLDQLEEGLNRLSGGYALITDPEAPETQRAIVASMDFARRALGKLEPQHTRSKLAILRVIEDEYVEAGLPIPPWVNDLKREHGLAE